MDDFDDFVRYLVWVGIVLLMSNGITYYGGDPMLFLAGLVAFILYLIAGHWLSKVFGFWWGRIFLPMMFLKLLLG